MPRRGSMAPESIRFALADSIAFLNASDWRSFEDYRRDMRSEHRIRIHKTISNLEALGIVLESLGAEQVKARATEIHDLYLQVHERQKLRLVTIGPRWIPALAVSFGDDFRTVVAGQKEGGKLLGFVNVLRDGKSAHGLYIGFDKAAATTGVPLYLAGVRQGIEMGAAQIFWAAPPSSPKPTTALLDLTSKDRAKFPVAFQKEPCHHSCRKPKGGSSDERKAGRIARNACTDGPQNPRCSGPAARLRHRSTH